MVDHHYLVFTKLDTQLYLMNFGMSLVSISILNDNLIPFLFYFLHDKVLMKRKMLLFVMDGFMSLSSALSVLMNISIVMIPSMIMTILYVDGDILEKSMYICYVFCLVMMLLVFILKFDHYHIALIPQLKTMKAIGYSYKQLLYIERYQILLFGIFSLLPIIVYGLLYCNAYSNHLINITNMMFLILSYIFVYIIICGYMIIKLNNSVKEVY